MAEELLIAEQADKEEKYRTLLPQVKALTTGEPDAIANFSNTVAALKQTFDFLWVGIYFVKENELVLGPFQGPIACTRIQLGKGVCGNAWERKETLIVPNVDAFPGHIACSSLSRSEIVLPGIDNYGTVKFVLDIDSENLNDFDNTDAHYLEEIVRFMITWA